MPAIIIVDIRNFTPHCEMLAKYDIEPLIELIGKSIDKSIRIIDHIKGKYKIKIKAYFNHTGDGFLVIMESINESFFSILFSQILRQCISYELSLYERKIKKILTSTDYQLLEHTKISFGIGIHKGNVKKYGYIYKIGEKEFASYAFISNAINIASRIEQSTKDHGRKVICSKEVYANFKNEYFKYNKRHIETIKYFDRLGGHKYKGVRDITYIYGVKSRLFINEAKNVLVNMPK